MRIGPPQEGKRSSGTSSMWREAVRTPWSTGAKPSRRVSCSSKALDWAQSLQTKTCGGGGEGVVSEKRKNCGQS